MCACARACVFMQLVAKLLIMNAMTAEASCCVHFYLIKKMLKSLGQIVFLLICTVPLKYSNNLRLV